MKLVKCPICGESYSDSYKACPFCAESGPYEGTVKRRKAKGRRVEKRRGPNILGPALIVGLLLLAALLIYTYFGDQIRERIHGNETPEDEVQVSVEPSSVELATGEIRLLTASGAEKFVWSSSDETVATVDAEGNVTAIAEGTATITVKDAAEDRSAQCQVTVKNGDTPDEPNNNDDPNNNEEPGNNDGPNNNEEPGSNDGPNNGESGSDTPVAPDTKLAIAARWNGKALPTVTIDGETIADMTLRSGSTSLYVSGTDSTVTWASDTAAVKVDQNGLVTRVSRGTAIITATVDGQTLKCRVLG